VRSKYLVAVDAWHGIAVAVVADGADGADGAVADGVAADSVVDVVAAPCIVQQRQWLRVPQQQLEPPLHADSVQIKPLLWDHTPKETEEAQMDVVEKERVVEEGRGRCLR